MSLIFTAQIAVLILSGLLAKEFGVRHVFGLCAIVLVLLVGVGYLWKKPAGKAVETTSQAPA
jgi:NADH:ubiquinone oxidoreductase subunit 3 (subunit A)